MSISKIKDFIFDITGKAEAESGRTQHAELFQISR